MFKDWSRKIARPWIVCRDHFTEAILTLCHTFLSLSFTYLQKGGLLYDRSVAHFRVVEAAYLGFEYSFTTFQILNILPVHLRMLIYNQEQATL